MVFFSILKFRNWPSVFTGSDLISWILKNLEVEDVTDALHLAYLLSSHGYLFPIDDHALTVKNDGTFYRFVWNILTPYRNRFSFKLLNFHDISIIRLNVS